MHSRDRTKNLMRALSVVLLVILPGFAAPAVGESSAEEGKVNEVEQLREAGAAAELRGVYREALGYYQRALAIDRESDRWGERADLTDLGNIHGKLGETARALEHYEQALAIAREFGNRRGEAIDLTNIGNVYADLGESAAALEHYEQALAIYREIRDRRREGETLTNIGSVYYNLGEYARAREYREQARIIQDQRDGRGLLEDEAADGEDVGTVSIPLMPEPDYAIVRVFFATDRNYTGSQKPVEMFGSSRAPVRYGTCDVSIPRDHRMGKLESPSVLRLEFRDDPAKHVALISVVLQSQDAFFAEVTARMRASTPSAFLFVHGYNVSFNDAARRTAQIAYDLQFEGAPVFYSWPSRGIKEAYTVDEQTIEWAERNLKGFLADFLSRSDAQNVYLIAHSMGNRAVTRAVASLLAEKPAFRQRLKEVILAAPDIDAEVFRRDIAPALIATGQPITLYASSKDRALGLSKMVHGYPRAGDSGKGLVVISGIETIDATETDTSFLGHAYFAETESVLSDIFYLIGAGLRAEQRAKLRSVDTQAGRYWIFGK